MAALRAKQVYAGVIAGTSIITVYTVPAGYRFILKFVSAQEQSGSSCGLQVRVSSALTVFTFFLAAFGVASSAQVGNFWIVCEPGDTIKLSRTTSGNCGVTVSGSLHAI